MGHLCGRQSFRTMVRRSNDMAKKKDCFGSESYVCRTQSCPYMAECVEVVWEKKLLRVMARKGTLDGKASSSSVRVRSKEFLRR